MRKGLAALAIAVSAASASALAPPAFAQVSFGINTPGISIGVNLNSYPNLVRIPGYPVYYAPSLGTNYFFYDGMYWVLSGTNWYASTWYDGPWEVVAPDDVPLFVLRVPVRYYVAPPVYFRGWSVSAAPRWGEHWGSSWEQHHRNWDNWNRNQVPAPAPLPTYQRQYTGNRYPTLAEQHTLEARDYHYRPRDQIVQRAFTARVQQAQSAPQGRPSSAQQAQTQQREQAQRTQHAQTQQREQAQARQQAQTQRTQQAQAQQRGQQQAQSKQQAQRAQQSRAQQSEARQQQAQAHQQQQTQAQRAQQSQAHQQQQAKARQQAQPQHQQQAQTQHQQQTAQHESQNTRERREQPNG